MAARHWKIGIDFGSTNSSAAFCLVSGPANGAKLQRIYPVQCSHHIPGRSMDEMSEFPTMLVYEGSTPIVHWGLNAWIIVKKIRANHIDPEQQVHVFESFKPLLQDECASSVFEERLAVLPFHKSLEDLITDYLTGLLHATKDQMMGCGYIEGDFVQFICTVPAMWTERAKQTTLASSERAQNNCKFTNGSASLCFEPVAAAAYVFQVDQSVDLEKNDAFVIVDGGGATVDLITYITKKVNPLRVGEIVKGKGGHCGSSYLNQRFEASIRARLATESYLWSHQNSKTLDSIIHTCVMNEFENVTKRAYPEETKIDVDKGWYTSYTIPGLEDNEDKGFHRGDLGITRRQLEDIFIPVLTQSWSLIMEQLLGAYKQGVYPRRLFLVGGLARSPRYRDYIRKQCENFTARNASGFPIHIITPRICESAIAQGAIRYYIDNGFVQDYLTRSCICITRNLQDDESSQEVQCAIFRDPLDGKKYVRDCIHILLGTDEVIPSTGRTVTKQLYRIVAASEHEVAIAIPIYVFEKENAIRDLPLQLQASRAHYLLTMAEFALDIAPIRHQLKQMKFGTVKPFESPKPVRRSGRSHNQNGPASHEASGGTSNNSNGCHQNSFDSHGVDDAYYYLVEFAFKVEFRAGWMTYHLQIENVESSKGLITRHLNLAAVVDPC